MEFEALEDEANAIHGDLWEQLNAGGQVNPSCPPHQDKAVESRACPTAHLCLNQPVINKWTKQVWRRLVFGPHMQYTSGQQIIASSVIMFRI